MATKAAVSLTLLKRDHKNFLNTSSSITGEKNTTESQSTIWIAITTEAGRSPRNTLDLDDRPSRAMIIDDRT